MYALVRRSKSKNPEEVIRKVRQPIEQLYSRLPGLVAYFAVRLPDGTFNATAVFEERQQAENARKEVQDLFQKHAKDLFEGTPEMSIGEVVAHRFVEVPETVT